MTPLKDDILSTIQTDDIKPKPKWWFILGYGTFWIITIASIIIGALSIAVLLFEIFTPDRVLIRMTERSLQGGYGLLQLLPFLWIAIMGVCLLVASCFFRKTEKGYLWSPGWILSGIVAISLLLGGILYGIKAPQIADEHIMKRLPPVAGARAQIEQFMQNPENGLVAGRILSLEANTVSLTTPGKRQVQVTIECKMPVCKRQFDNLQVGRPGIFKGTYVSDSEFMAEHILDPKKVEQKIRDRFQEYKKEGRHPGKKPEGFRSEGDRIFPPTKER